MKSSSLLSILVLFVLAGACGGPTLTKINGFTVEKARTEKAFAEIRSRASFEMNCPKEKLSLTILKANKVADVGPDYVRAQHVGVMGCERKMVYVRDRNGEQWLANTATNSN